MCSGSGAKARWSAFLRGDNLAGKTYAGTVIVNEANRRYFESAASVAIAWRVNNLSCRLNENGLRFMLVLEYWLIKMLLSLFVNSFQAREYVR